MADITLDDIRKNDKINIMINHANQCLEAVGYTDHGPRHVGYVSRIAGSILERLKFPKRRVELAKIAGWVHDIGNMINRHNHGLSGAVLLYPILLEMGMPVREACEIVSAVGAHEEETGNPVSDISAALIIADKVDAHKARVRVKKYNPEDIHNRVNFSIKETRVRVDADKRLITYELRMDSLSSIMEFMQIYLSRMEMCEKSANFLGCAFALKVNGTVINNIKEIK